jgi:prephenate dehydrogenase
VSRPRVAIVGLGLIGGSLARALTLAGYRVVGVDKEKVRRRVRARGAVAKTVATPEQAAALADILVLAAPPHKNLALLRRLADVASPRLVITDVGSVKGPICREAARLGLESFVGGHPVAGNEGRGFAASSAHLFRGRPWALVPMPGGARALARVRALVRAVGGRPLVVSPQGHDRALAFLSHLPQVVAYALRAAAGRDPVAARHLHLAGPGFGDMTRLARSPRRLWREILEENEPEVARALRAFRRALSAARTGR